MYYCYIASEFFKGCFFRTALSWRQNWTEITQISHKSPAHPPPRPLYTQLPLLSKSLTKVVHHTYIFIFIFLIFNFNFFSFFLMWTTFKVFIEFVTILLLFWFFWPRGMWDLSSLTRDQTHTPCIGSRSLNHWTAREVPTYIFKIIFW